MTTSNAAAAPDEGGRVLLIANNFPPLHGGSAVVYGNLANCAEGAISVVAARLNYIDERPFDGWREHDAAQSYRVVRLPLLRTPLSPPKPNALARVARRLHDLWIRSRLAAVVLWLIASERPTAVCVGELLASAWLLRLLATVTSTPVIAYVHGEEITTADASDPTFEGAKAGLRAATRIVAVSRFTARAIERLLGDDDRLRLIENGVDAERFQPGPRRADLLQRYGLTDRFVFVSVGRLVARKGLDHAIQAFARIAQSDPHTRFLIVGDGPYRGDLHAVAEAEGVSDKVLFAGAVPDADLADHYRLGDVFLMPNRTMPDGDTEGFGLVFLEANACGLPVIAGRDGGAPDAVEHGLNGLIVDGGCIDAIEIAMRALCGDAALRETLRRGGQARVATSGWRQRTAAFIELCANAGRPSHG